MSNRRAAACRPSVPASSSVHRRALAAVVGLVTAMAGLGSGCAFNALGRAPDDLDLGNDGTPAAQSALYRSYEVVYDRGVVRRPGADPAAVAAEIHVKKVDDVSAQAWSDDAYNYLATSDEAAAQLEDPAVGFDQFAHSGNGELVIIGLGAGAGLVGGALTWFVPTTVRDGVSADESNQLSLDASAGFVAGLSLGVIVAAAYTYIVPSVTTPLAAPKYRAAVRAFNDELDARVTSPADAHEGGHSDGHGDGHADGDAAAADEPCTDCDKASCPTQPAGDAPPVGPAASSADGVSPASAEPRPVDAPAAPR